jgi:hypothetical protein
VASLAWLVSRIIDRGFHHAVQHARTHRRGGESILILMQRITRIAMVLIAVVAASAVFGLDVKTALAGLGIGGLAIALAAHKSLENLIGGVSLLMDKAVQVGDFCRIGDRLGTVVDIGLRSLKMRTLDQNLLVVPNGALAQMQFENMRARSRNDPGGHRISHRLPASGDYCRDTRWSMFLGQLASSSFLNQRIETSDLGWTGKLVFFAGFLGEGNVYQRRQTWVQRRRPILDVRRGSGKTALCRYLFRNPAIPTGIGGYFSVPLGHRAGR